MVNTMFHPCFVSLTDLVPLLFHSSRLRPSSALPGAWRAQSSFSSVASSSSAPRSCFPPSPPPVPARRQLHHPSVGEAASALTRPTSLPSAPETGTGQETVQVHQVHQVQELQLNLLPLLLLLCSLCFSVYFPSPLCFQLPGRVNGDLLNLRPI